MLQGRQRSYRTEHAKRQAYDKMMQHIVGAENICPDKLMTDRASYISYLESQLERITAACLTMHSFDERIESVTSSTRGLEEKVLNVARLVKCTQSYAEEQEGLAKRALSGLAQRMQRLEAAAFPVTGPRDSQLALEVAEGPSPWTPAQEQFIQAKLEAMEARVEARLADRLGGLEEAVASLASKEELQRSLDCIQMLEGMHSVFQKEVEALAGERSQFNAAVETLKADMASAHSLHQDLAVKMLESIERAVDAEVRKGMQSLVRAEGHVQTIAGDIRRSAQDAMAGLSPPRSPQRMPASPSQMARTDHQRPAGAGPSRYQDARDAAGDVERMIGAGAMRASDLAAWGNPGSPVRDAAQHSGLWAGAASPPTQPWRRDGEPQAGSPRRQAGATAALEAELQQQMADVQGTMSGVQSSFAAMRGALSSMHEALAHDADVSRQVSRDRSAGHERNRGGSSRSLLGGQSPLKAAARQPGASRSTSRRQSGAGGSAQEPASSASAVSQLQRRQRLQQLYADLQAIEDASSQSDASAH